MPALTPEEWQALSPHLDEALDLSDEERSLWLSSLRVQQPALARQLATLLQEHRAVREESFLEKRSVPLPTPSGLSGQSLGRYTLISQIGYGGMGNVWLAERNDGRFERRVAVKFLNLALLGKSGEERFKREGSILGRLAHPHIAALLDAGVAPAGQPYLVLEHVDGERIDRYCDEHRLDVKARVRLFLDVLIAVAHAHANLIVHRDIKPSNVLVTRDGKVKLLDFGIAKLLADEGGQKEASLTVEGVPMTPEYAAPEQLQGGALTTGTDVYALGVLLYVLLTGQHPVATGLHSPAELVSAIVDREPTRPSGAIVQTLDNANAIAANAARRAATPEKLRRLLRGDLDTIILKALKKDPTERYPSVTALADDLRRYLRNQAIGARPDTMAYRAAKFVRRNRTVVTLAALAALATGVGVVGTLIQAGAARAQRDFALQQVERSEALNEFHEFLLSDAAPSGKPFTVSDLLKRAEHIVERQHAATDPNRVRLLISIGYQYTEQDQAGSGRRVLEEAYKLSRGSNDASIRAAASCTLGAALARDEELSRAETLFQEGLRELPTGPQFALERIRCLRSGSEIAVQRGDVGEGIARAETAQTVLRQSPFDSEALELERWIDLATAYSAAGRDERAISAFEQASALLSSLGRDQTENASVAFCNWAVELDQIGRPLEAEKMYRRAISIDRAGKTEEEVSPILLTNYARTLEELGRLTEAADYAARAYSKAQRIGNQLAIDYSLLERARVYNARKDAARAESMLQQVEPRLRRRLPAGHYGFASLASQRAINALLKGDIATARKLADQAVAIDEAAITSGGEGSSELPGLLINRSVVELAASHPDQAVADASRVLDLLQRGNTPLSPSSIRGSAYLALGRALRSQGKVEEARAAFRQAAENLRGTVGPDHPDTRAAQQWAAIEVSGQ